MSRATRQTTLCCLLFLCLTIGWSDGQKKTKTGTSIAGSEVQPAVEFDCPEEFGYYPDPHDCTRYYVCVFGGALLESCTGGLAYSHDLQTCDWPRNVDCIVSSSNKAGTAAKPKAKPSTSAASQVTQFLDSRSSSSKAVSPAPAKSRITLELLEDPSILQDSRQGRDFQVTSSRTGPVQQGTTGGALRNTFPVEAPRSSSARPIATTAELEFADDFVPATTFNPSSARFLNSRALHAPFDDFDEQASTVFLRYDDDDEDDNTRPTGPRRHRDGSDGQEAWRSGQRQRIPSMHFGNSRSGTGPVNDGRSSQRPIFEPLQFGPVPVRVGGGGSAHDESRQFLQPSGGSSENGRFQPIHRPVESGHRGQSFDNAPLPVPIQLRTPQPQFQPVSPTAQPPSPQPSPSFINRHPLPPSPTTIPFETDSIDESRPPWILPPQRPQQQQQQQQQPQRPSIESAAVAPARSTASSSPSTEQFFRETTSTQQQSSQFDFDWNTEPEQPARQPVQTARPAPVEQATPRAATRTSQQSSTRFQQPVAAVDYTDDEFGSTFTGNDEFTDYEDFVEPPTRPPATTTTTTTTTTTPKPTTTKAARVSKPAASQQDRGGSRFRPDSSSSVDEEPAMVQQTGSKRRPTLKPVSDLVPNKVAETVDIFKHPPRRLEPIFAQPTPDEPAAKCNAEVCRLPDCFCGGKDIPGGFKSKDVPQLVLLTFDDSVNDLNKDLYKDLFENGRLNPNGCPIAATFYVSHEWTDYGQVQNLYADGHEIASHTISHSFGEQFSAKKWAREAAGQRDVLAAYGGVRMEDVRGLRAPFLSVGGNRMFKMLYDMNFTYDSSMPVYENKPPSWPYTLDYKIFHDCMIPPCPTKSYPGVWEVPMVMWQDLNGGRCSMGDGCSNPPDAEGVYKMLIKNFERHYTTNRAPFPLYYHAAWFTTPHHKEGFEAFLDTIVSMDDVWLVTNWQAIQWVRDPTPLDRVKSFKPFQCDYPERPKRCNAPKVCNAWHKSGVRYMRTCQPCPEVFPWTGKTGVRNAFLDSYEGNEAS